jgi:hypothetical protein
MNMPVSVGGIRRMSNDTPTSETPEERARRERVENIVRGTGAEALQSPFNFGGWLDTASENARRNQELIRDYYAPQTPELTTAQKLAQQTQFQQQGRRDQDAAYENRLAQTGSYFPGGGGSSGGGGGGGARPNFAPYREALIGQADALNARIQAMYNQLAEQAGTNVERISGIYGGAGEGIGNVYDSATANVADAYGSAQQQAADQLARLGIEAAAPAVIDPMALSQAQAVSGLEQGRASGQAATERYGATAGGFGSQMAQVAQQQGTEMNAAILGALQQRLNDSILMEEQGRMAGGGGGSARDALTAYQQAQLMAGAEGRAIDFTQWEQEQGRRQLMDAASLALQISQAEKIPYTEALAQATGILSGQAPAAPAQSSGNWFTNLFS